MGNWPWPTAESLSRAQRTEQRLAKVAETQDTDVDGKLSVYCNPLSTEQDSCTPMQHARDDGMDSQETHASAHLQPGLLLC